jgi:hypothetical protein
VRRTRAFAASWSAEPAPLIPFDREIAATLPAALAQVRASLAPGDPAAVAHALARLYRRFDMEPPAPGDLDLDVAEMSAWPADLFEQAFRHVWTTYALSRRPRVSDFLAGIADDLAERRADLHALEALARKLEHRRRRS